jgi:hypothetical protein
MAFGQALRANWPSLPQSLLVAFEQHQVNSEGEDFTHFLALM